VTPCPHDGTSTAQPERYPQALCSGCVDRATDLAGRAVAMHNTSLYGGFAARHVDDGSPCEQVTADGAVLVDGRPYRGAEARYGGVVVEP